MLTLALESTTATASAALCREENAVAHMTLHAGNTHSTVLLPMAETLLRLSHLTPNDVELFACSVGPGSFTGIRIGAATIKGLAFGRSVPCVGVSAVEALAYRLRAVNGIVCPLINARRTQFYSALFRIENGTVTRLTPDDVILAADLPALLTAYDEPIYLNGDGYESARPHVLHPQLQQTPPELRLPDALAVAACAAEHFKKATDPNTFTAEALSPIYLRKTQAEREREERIAAQV